MVYNSCIQFVLADKAGSFRRNDIVIEMISKPEIGAEVDVVCVRHDRQHENNGRTYGRIFTPACACAEVHDVHTDRTHRTRNFPGFAPPDKPPAD